MPAALPRPSERFDSLGSRNGLKRRFLGAALGELAGVAQVSFEGDLSSTSLFDLVGESSDETQVLKRNTPWPKQDFVVLPLDAEMVGPIMAAVGGTMPRGIITYRSKRRGRLELGLYDNFAPKSVFLGPGLTHTFIATLQEAGVLVPGPNDNACEVGFSVTSRAGGVGRQVTYNPVLQDLPLSDPPGTIAYNYADGGGWLKSGCRP